MKQYYKLVDTVHGHHGMFYAVGLNVDPNPVKPIEEVGSCEAGALYFATLDQLAAFTNYGDSIAWVTPKSKVVRDSGKYKAHKILITKLLPIKKAIPLLVKEGMNPEDAESFGYKFTAQEVMRSKYFSFRRKLDWLASHGKSQELMDLIYKNRNNKDAMKTVQQSYIHFSIREIRILVDRGVDQALTSLEISKLLIARDYKRLAKLIHKDPKRYLSMF